MQENFLGANYQNGFWHLAVNFKALAKFGIVTNFRRAVDTQGLADAGN